MLSAAGQLLFLSSVNESLTGDQEIKQKLRIFLPFKLRIVSFHWLLKNLVEERASSQWGYINSFKVTAALNL